MPKLFALGDVHIGHKLNAEAFESLRPGSAGDGLILAGDVGETRAHMELCFKKATSCFDHVFWIPGNHELYTVPSSATLMDKLKGEAKYLACVELAREYGVRTPEDPWMVWEGEAGESGIEKVIVALVFTLYDYSFRPPNVPREGALEWAREEGIEATDEALLFFEPRESRDAWCHALCEKWEAKFEQYAARYPHTPFVIVNHWPLREDLVHIPLVPRFSLWCGTKRTDDWHRKGRFGKSGREEMERAGKVPEEGEPESEHPGAKVVVTGHLHVRRTDWIDGTRFEECSLGYPRQWVKARDAGRGVNDMLREILPGPEKPPGADGRTTTQWRSLG